MISNHLKPVDKFLKLLINFKISLPLSHFLLEKVDRPNVHVMQNSVQLLLSEVQTEPGHFVFECYLRQHNFHHFHEICAKQKIDFDSDAI